MGIAVGDGMGEVEVLPIDGCCNSTIHEAARGGRGAVFAIGAKACQRELRRPATVPAGLEQRGNGSLLIPAAAAVG